jgi:hypothetical protein
MNAIKHLLPNEARILQSIALTAIALCTGCAELPRAAPPPAPREQVLKPTPVIERIAGVEGGARTVLYSVPVRGGRLEIRMLALPRGKPIALRFDHETALELRGGAIESGVADKPQRRAAGEAWTARAGEQLSFRVISETAVLREMALVPER